MIAPVLLALGPRWLVTVAILASGAVCALAAHRRAAVRAHTYKRPRSTLLVSVEHPLYGNFVFSVGLGALFYSAS